MNSQNHTKALRIEGRSMAFRNDQSKAKDPHRARDIAEIHSTHSHLQTFRQKQPY